MPFKVKKQQTQKLRTIQSAQYIPIRPIDIIHLRIDLELWFWVANKIIRNEYFHLPLDPKTIYTKIIKPLKYGCQQPQRFAGLWGSCIGTPWNPRLPSFFNSIFFGSSNLFNSHGHLRHFNSLYTYYSMVTWLMRATLTLSRPFARTIQDRVFTLILGPYHL